MNAAIEQGRPILVVGMHRSGTRLVADILAALGLFMGADRQGDSESITFIRLNEAILHQCGTFWSEPLPAHVAMTDPERVEQLAAAVREALVAQLPRYLGGAPPPWGPSSGDMPNFGWKDPRNTFTLPVWKQIFPGLRIVHVLRHGVDVAASLARRQREMCTAAAGTAVPSPLAVFREHSLGVLSTRRGWDVHEAFGLWEQYAEKARLESSELGERALEIRFEALLARPDEGIAALARFCGLELATDGRLLERIESKRAFAFRREPELEAFAAGVSDILAVYGYSP